jgi:Cytochrome P460
MPDWTSETLAVMPMSKMSKTKATTVAGISLAAMLGMIVVAANGQMSTVVKEQTVADANGNLHVPDAYRTTYQALGSWAVEAEQGRGLKQLHVVYASPGTIEAYRKDKRFPEGTVLVKEVFQTASGQMTTGTVSHADSLKGWFVMVKDSNGRYPGNKLWGNGWGWSWFDADNPSKTTSTDYKANCFACHVPAQPTDWIYTGGYPH